MSVAVDAGRVRSDAAFIIGVFLLSRLAVVATLALAVALRPEIAVNGPLAPLCRWDCYWYLDLARDGYDRAAGHWGNGSAANWAFFPVLPLLLGAAQTLVGGNPLVVALLVGQGLFLLTLFLFHAYASEMAPPGDAGFARFATGLLAAWPFAIYFATPMSEAVFLPLSLAALLLARRDRWLLAGLAAAALSGSRLVGVLIVPALVLIAARQHGWRALVTLRPGTERVALGLALSGLGVGLFMLHLHALTGDALAFLHVQVAWMRQFKWPWMMLIDELNPFVKYPGRLALNAYFAAVGAGAVALAAVLWRRRRALAPEFAFTAAVMAVVSVGGRLMSLPRVLGVLFPLVLALALTARSARARALVLALSGAGSVGVMLVLFLEYTLGLLSELAM